MKESDKYKRCAICDHCYIDHPDEPRTFIWDEMINGWSCSDCMKVIVSDLGTSVITKKDHERAYWLGLTERAEEGDPFPRRPRDQLLEETPVDPLQARLNTYLEVDDGS